MRFVFFAIFGLMLVGLIALVDWSEKFAEVVPKDKIKIFREMVGQNSSIIQSANADSSSRDQNEMGPGQLLPRTEAEQGPDAVPSPQSEARNKHDSRMNATQDLPKFQDVLEEPYLKESRQLLQQIRANYEKISGKSTVSDEPGKAQ